MAKTFKFRSTVDADWDRFPKIEGKVKEEPKAVPELENRKVMVIEGDIGIFRVYESFDLQELFNQAKVGDSVSIEYLGTVQLKKGGRTLKQFNAQLWRE